MKIKFSILNYGMGNIFSIMNAFNSLNININEISEAKDIKNADAIILPGVGGYPAAINSLKKNKMIDEIFEHNEKQKLIIGICLGMQLLFDCSEEIQHTSGLGLIKGKILKFSNKNNNNFNVGWRNIKVTKNSDSIFKNLNNKSFYFIHSYYAKVMNKNNIITYSNFNDKNFASSVNMNNIYGFQFHPEKSGENGLNIYRNIIKKYNNY